jgi:hypothetical protein
VAWVTAATRFMAPVQAPPAGWGLLAATRGSGASDPASSAPMRDLCLGAGSGLSDVACLLCSGFSPGLVFEICHGEVCVLSFRLPWCLGSLVVGVVWGSWRSCPARLLGRPASCGWAAASWWRTRLAFLVLRAAAPYGGRGGGLAAGTAGVMLVSPP